ncbi:hypothetical protein [Aliikangiella sp. G2MR2-5]|uniref:hypothetical protein n=1 Tax=Aliikangiella sp. G2MR2-5 TaxID=2788943 RepID=UPI0018AC83B5|nr:hypothetical protein [Aliikangiella sp. G2MR2-5]
MIRFLIRFLLVVIVLSVLAALGAQWKLDNDLKNFAKRLQPFVDLQYESVSLSYTGEVRINSITAYVEMAKYNVEIGEIRFSVGNIMDLILFQNNVESNELPESAYIKIKGLLLPFNNEMISAYKTHKKLTSWDLLESAYCGDINHISIGTLEKMGYHYFSLNTELYYMLDQYSGSIVFNGVTEFEDMFKLDYQMNIVGVLTFIEAFQNQATMVSMNKLPAAPKPSLFELRVTDLGYHENKATYCAGKEGVTQEEYYQKHTDKVVEALASVGIEASDTFKSLYPEAVKPNSEFYWFMQPQPTFDIESMPFYTFEELTELGGLRVSINNKPLGNFLNNWNLENFNKLAAVVLEEKRKAEAEEQRYKSIILKREYHQVPLTKASQYVEYQVKVTRNDGTVYEGRLTKTSSRYLWVEVHSEDGKVVLPLVRSSIKRFEANIVVEEDA